MSRDVKRGGGLWEVRLLRRLLPAQDVDLVLEDLRELAELRRERTDPDEARRWYRRQLRGYLLRVSRYRLTDRPGQLERARAAAQWDVLHGRVPGGRGRVGERIGEFSRDLRFALRTLVRTPGYTVAVIVTLGLGIGANTAIFSIINGVLLKPLPYGEGSDLVYLRQPELTGTQENVFFSVKDIEDLRERNRSFVDVAEYHSMSFILHGRGDAEMVRTGVVSSDFFDLMGMEPILGRSFIEEDDRLGAEPVLMLSYGYWQSRFGGDPEIVGEGMTMNGQVHTVIGVLPPVPQHPRENDVYMPTSACPTRSGEDFIADRNARMMAVFARMRSGTTVEDAQRDLTLVSGRLAEEYPEAYPVERGRSFRATPLKEELVRNARPTLLLLLGTAGLVLLIACANVANLTLARTTRRRQELAVRTALGASAPRLARQLLTESTLLGLAGGVVGLAVAWAGMDLLVAFAARFTPRAQEASVSLPVLFFALATSVGTGLLFGAAPLASLGRGLGPRLRLGEGATPGRGRNRLQGGLVVAQFALAFTLLAGSGLALRSFWELSRVDPGLRAENVLTFRVAPWGSEEIAGLEDIRAFVYEVRERVSGLPGVRSVGISDIGPMEPGYSMLHGVRVAGAEETDGTRLPQAQPRVASEGYFEAVGIPVEAGRAFALSDREGTVPVAVVNAAFARTVLGLPSGEVPDAVGMRFKPCSMGGDCLREDLEERTIVGVVGDVRVAGLESEPPAEWFRPSGQGGWPGAVLAVRTGGDPLALVDGVRATVKELDAGVPVYSLNSLDQIRKDSLAPRRLTMILLLLFASVAFAVSLAGIAGVIAFSVSQRTREIGIRIALGAQRGEVLRSVMTRGLALIALGLALGTGGAAVISRILSRSLWGVSGADPVTLILAAAVLVGMGGVACYLPGRRATRIDPREALRTS